MNIQPAATRGRTEGAPRRASQRLLNSLKHFFSHCCSLKSPWILPSQLSRSCYSLNSTARAVEAASVPELQQLREQDKGDWCLRNRRLQRLAVGKPSNPCHGKHPLGFGTAGGDPIPPLTPVQHKHHHLRLQQQPKLQQRFFQSFFKYIYY